MVAVTHELDLSARMDRRIQLMDGAIAADTLARTFPISQLST